MAASVEYDSLKGEADALRETIKSLESHREQFANLLEQRRTQGSSDEGFFGSMMQALGGFFEFMKDAALGDRDEKAAQPAKDGAAPPDLREQMKSLQSSAAGASSGSPEAVIAELQAVITTIVKDIERMNGELSAKDAKLSTLADEMAAAERDEATPVDRNETDTGRKGDVRDDDGPVIRDQTDVGTIVDEQGETEKDDRDTDGPVIVDDTDRQVIVDDTDRPVIVDDTDRPVIVDDTHRPVRDTVEDVVIVDEDTVSYDDGQQTDMGELDGGFYDVVELLRAGKTVADLRSADIPAAIVRAAGLDVSALITGGYPIYEIYEAGYTLGEMRDCGVPVATAKGLSGVTLHEMRDVWELQEIRMCYEVSELRTAYQVTELREGGFNAGELLHAGVAIAELAHAGFGSHDLVDAGANIEEVKALFPNDFAAETNDDYAPFDPSF